MRKSKFDPRNHIGETHGVYTIIDVLDAKDKYGHYIYVGSCNECGYKKYSHYGEFSGEKSKAVECRHLTVDSDYIQRIKWNNRRIQSIFYRMRQRCYNINNKSYPWYGGKGIQICREWMNNPLLFEEWSLQNGYNDKLTIDRINENKDYSPDNCRWITESENSKYKSTTSIINIDGEVHTGKDWSKILGLGVNTINTYIREYGLESTKKLMVEMIKLPPSTKHRKRGQTWFAVYGIQI